MVSAIWSNAAASSRTSPGPVIGPTRTARCPLAILRVTAMIRSTGRVIRRAMASPVSRASSAANPAAPKMARSSAVRSAWSALASPEPVNRTSARPARSPRTTIGAPVAGSDDWVVKPGEDETTDPCRSRIWTSAPACPARSSTGARSAAVQLSFLSQAAPAATAIALVSSACCRVARAETSAAANPAVSPATRATAARATEMKASASRSPRAVRRDAGTNGGPPPSVIAGEAQPVSAAHHGLHDPGPARILLDLAAQVLHVRIDGPLIPLELIPADPVDQLVA